MFKLSNKIEVGVFVSGRERQIRPYNDGNGTRHVVELNVGDRFTVRVKNRMYGQRAIAVAGVDGANPLTGRPASIHDRGRIIESGRTWELAGWRTSTNAVREFTVVAAREAYVLKLGHCPDAVGLIGLAVFAENVHVDPTSRDPARVALEKQIAGGRCAGASLPAGQTVGTGQGRTREDRSQLTQTRRGDLLATFELEYHERAWLVRKGLVAAPVAVMEEAEEPMRAFPGDARPAAHRPPAVYCKNL
jgi:hypothetical protein